MRKYIIIITSSLLLSPLFAYILLHPQEKEVVVVKHKVVYLPKSKDFSEDLLKKEIAKYSFRFPEIVYAQAVLECGFSSHNFKNYNNLFGMKVAKSRLTTAKSVKGTSHASYDTWRLSVTDRALFETSFLRGLKTEEDYYKYLGDNYASDVNYVNKLKSIVNGRR